jgi:hypothetical protein
MEPDKESMPRSGLIYKKIIARIHGAPGHGRHHGTTDIALYPALGFEPVPPYWDSAVQGTLYFEKRLGLN